jgi:hypothetical protein
MNDDERAEMLLDIARRHQTTAWEVYQMARLCVFGPDAVDNPVFDPRDELSFDLSCIEDLLAERPSIPELLTVWQHCHDVVVALIERQTDPRPTRQIGGGVDRARSEDARGARALGDRCAGHGGAHGLFARVR